MLHRRNANFFIFFFIIRSWILSDFFWRWPSSLKRWFVVFLLAQNWVDRTHVRHTTHGYCSVVFNASTSSSLMLLMVCGYSSATSDCANICQQHTHNTTHALQPTNELYVRIQKVFFFARRRWLDWYQKVKVKEYTQLRYIASLEPHNTTHSTKIKLTTWIPQR